MNWSTVRKTAFLKCDICFLYLPTLVPTTGWYPLGLNDECLPAEPCFSYCLGHHGTNCGIWSPLRIPYLGMIDGIINNGPKEEPRSFRDVLREAKEEADLHTRKPKAPAKGEPEL